MPRDLTTFSISANAKFKLLNCGFVSADDLKDFKPAELAKETGLSAEEALGVLKIVFPDPKGPNKSSELLCASALDILSEETRDAAISTSCSALNNILGGGIPLKKVTELCGSPGTGKTQLCLQICTNVVAPKAIGGLDAESLFIDTEGSFVIERLAQIAAATVKNYRNTKAELSVEKILKSIYYYQCKSYTEVIARVNLLPQFLEEHKKISLIVVDSIAFHFRYGFDGTYALRTRLLNGIMQTLVKVANNYKVAVVLTNQMTTKIDQSSSSFLIPALGESWGHACTNRLILSWVEDKRQAHLLKSPSMPEACAFYAVTKDGIRDVS